MDISRYKQFLMESKVIEDSTVLATRNADRLNYKYESMSEEDLMFEGPQLLLDMEYWEGRLRLEDRILADHIEKYKDLIFDDEI